MFNDLYRQGYSRLGELHEDDAINLYIPKLLEAINKNDTDKVKGLLSYEVRDEYTDDDVQALVDIFTGELEDPCPKEWIDSSSLSGGGKYVATVSSNWVFISSDDSMYSIAFTIKYLDDYYPRNEGFEYICVFDKYREAYFNYYSETFDGIYDNDGDIYNLNRDYYDVSEKVSLSYISVPLFVAFGQPYSNKLSVYGKLTIIPMLNISKSITASGTYTSTGYYPQWDVTLHDIPELGFNTDAQCYNNDMNMNVSSFILTGSLSAGVYYPLCNLNMNADGSQFVLKGGVRLDYTLMSVAGKPSTEDIANAKYHLGTYNTIENTNVFSPIIEIGLVYLLKK